MSLPVDRNLLTDALRECDAAGERANIAVHRYGIARHVLQVLEDMHNELEGRSMYDALCEQNFNFDLIMPDCLWWPGQCEVLAGMALHFLHNVLELDYSALAQMLMLALPESNALTRQLLRYEKTAKRGRRLANYAALNRAIEECGEFLEFGHNYLIIAQSNTEWMDEDE